MIGGIGVELNFLESLLFGLISGLTDILPVSAQAHKAMMLTLFGVDTEPAVLRAMIHLATVVALYFACSKQILRISRQLKLARIPKKRRKRPVDMKVILDYRLMRTMVIPVIIGYFFFQKTAFMNHSISWAALFLLLNAVILFLPQLLPSGNKDSRSMSRVESLLIGLGGGLGIFPGVSSMGAMTSVASVCGVERTYALNISLMMNMVINAMLVFFDILSIGSGGISGLSIGIFLGYLLAAVVAFLAVSFAVRLLRMLTVHHGYSIFAWYSLAAALLMFILYLMV